MLVTNPRHFGVVWAWVVTIMISSCLASSEPVDLSPGNIGRVEGLSGVAVEPKTDGSGLLRISVSGRTAKAVTVSANLVIGPSHSPKLRATVPIKEMRTQEASENAPKRSWYVEIEAAPETAAEATIEVFFDPTDKPAGNGQLYRVIVKEFLRDK